ncbi:Probable LRR receptor-like serine/threonine-protein kinase RKF3, partial [Linum perenne]
LLLAPTTIAQTNTILCPLEFSILLNLVTSNSGRLPVDRSQPCLMIRRGLRLLHSDYLRRTGSFLPPLSSAESCWTDFQRLLRPSSISSSNSPSFKPLSLSILKP